MTVSDRSTTAVCDNLATHQKRQLPTLLRIIHSVSIGYMNFRLTVDGWRFARTSKTAVHVLQKVAEGFSNNPYRMVKMLEKSCPVVDSTALSCLIAKTLCEVVRDAEKLLSVDFQRYGLLG